MNLRYKSGLKAWWHGLTHFHRIAVREYDFSGERQRWRNRYCYDCGREFGWERIA